MEQIKKKQFIRRSFLLLALIALVSSIMACDLIGFWYSLTDNVRYEFRDLLHEVEDTFRNGPPYLQRIADIFFPEASPQEPTIITPNPEESLLEPGSSGGVLKPVGFHNLGSIAITVLPQTYLPAGTTEPALPPDASTVAFPGSTGYVSLPLGTFTWCYQWEGEHFGGSPYTNLMHALDERPVILDMDDNDQLEFAETVSLVAPPATGSLAGACGQTLDISEWVTESNHVDEFEHYAGSGMGLAHFGDWVTLRGPITVVSFFQHRPDYTTPFTLDPLVTTIIPAGETRTFTLEENTADHPGDWDLFIVLLSVDE